MYIDIDVDIKVDRHDINIHTCTHIHTHTDIHMQTYIHTYMHHTYIHAYIHMYILYIFLKKSLDQQAVSNPATILSTPYFPKAWPGLEPGFGVSGLGVGSATHINKALTEPLKDIS